jgi:type VI secretion system secreted protein Hcp
VTVLDAALTIVGPNGPIRGGSTLRGREGTIPVLAVCHRLRTPRDVVSGQPSGRRQHDPIVVTKEVDRSTPLLVDALLHNAALVTWRLDVFAPDTFGRLVPAYAIELTRPQVTEVTLLPDDLDTAAVIPRLPRETVAFVYERITWTWRDGNVTTSDTWVDPA